MDSIILTLLDYHACQSDLNRSQIINRAVKQYLFTVFGKDPAFWDRLYQDLQAKGKL